MSSTFGNSVKVQIFGQSHSEAIGVVVDGLPAGEPVDLGRLAAFMARRAPGKNAWSTPRSEADAPRVLSGLNQRGRTCGAPLAFMIENTNTRSSDYSNIARNPRPGHADLTAQARWHGEQDVAGGGHFSGRLTACLCAAGGVAIQLLERRGIRVAAHIRSIAGIEDEAFDPVSCAGQFGQLQGRAFPVLDEQSGLDMQAAIAGARACGDSVGGVIECACVGLPAGVGSPMFDGIENAVSKVVFGIPAVKGVEFGAGFAVAGMYGSQNNDPIAVGEDRRATCLTNNAGGILGGITTGMPLIVRAAFKPTPSISCAQQTVDVLEGAPSTLEVAGRHDPCVVVRAVPVMEAAVALAVLDCMAADGMLGQVSDGEVEPAVLQAAERLFGR